MTKPLLHPAKRQDVVMGRPPKYRSAYQMQLKIDEYFATAEYPSKAALALHLGLAAWDEIKKYDSKNPHFWQIIKKAETRIEAWLNDKMMKSPQHMPACAFRLKCGHGYVDVQSVDHSGKISLQVVSTAPEADKPGTCKTYTKQLTSGND